MSGGLWAWGPAHWGSWVWGRPCFPLPPEASQPGVALAPCSGLTALLGGVCHSTLSVVPRHRPGDALRGGGDTGSGDSPIWPRPCPLGAAGWVQQA